MTRNPRVLMSAYQCGPGMGSVSQIGWEWYSRMARRLPLTLVTHTRNRKALEAAGAPIANSEIIYIDTEWFAGPLYRLASRIFPRSQHAVFLTSSADFFVYDRAVLRKLRKRRKDWDLVHAVTPVSPVSATRLHRLRLPIILGPWNGGMQSPRTFPAIMNDDSAWMYRIRDAGRVLDKLFGTTKHASLVLTATKATSASLPPHTRTQVMSENGVDLEMFHPRTASGFTLPLRIVFVGRLIPVKGIFMLFDALAQIRGDFAFTLTIVGDGPLRADLEREAQTKNLKDVVTFTGAQPLSEVARYVRESHIFCLPSVRESGGAAIMESLASGVPALGVNYGGPAEILDDSVGKLLSADGPEQLTKDIVDAFRDIVKNPAKWKAKGETGRRRAEQQYGWDARMDTAIDIYRQVLQRCEVNA
jgi:glycosyltransferase involved in cell wall biosynthesis